MRGLPVTLSWGRAQAVALALAVLGAGAAPACARAAELSATPSTFAGVFSGAQAGDTIRLASGNYGTFRGALKSGMVTIAPHSGATATMALRLNPAANITLDGLKITDALIAGTATKNLVVRNSDFDGARVTFRGDHLVNANVLFDNNVHSNVDVCSGCSDARVHIAERNDAGPNGITIRNSRFYGGSADGILNGGNGTRIIANTFRDLFQTGAGGAHTDSLQLYGSKNTLVKANFFYNVDMGNPSAYDRADHEIIEDNVVVSSRYPFPMQLLSDNGSIVRHNTFVSTSTRGGGCDYNLPCGIVRMGNKSGDPPSVGTVVKDNVLAEISITGRTPSYAEEDYNLFTHRRGSGANDRLGQPIFVGGERPTTYEGFRLAAGSPGKGTASDGLDRGARIGTNAPPPAPEPAPEPTPAPTASYAYSPWSPTTGQQVTFDGSGSTCPSAPCDYRWEDDGPDGPGGTQWPLGTGRTLTFTFSGAGNKHVRLVVTGADGKADSTVKMITVTAAASEPAPGPPTASFTYSPSSPVSGQEVTLDGSGSTCPAMPCSFRWEDDGPDGPGGTQWPLGDGQTLGFTFSGAGDKRVRMTVTDAGGRSDSTVKVITVVPPN